MLFQNICVKETVGRQVCAVPCMLCVCIPGFIRKGTKVLSWHNLILAKPGRSELSYYTVLLTPNL